MNLEDRYLQSLASSFVEPVEPQPAAQPEPTPVAGTVRPGAMQGEMRAIPQTRIEKVLETAGVTLEQFGQELDKLGKVSIGGVEIGLRDLLPFVGSTEKVEDPRTGETVTKEVGTPQALKMAGRGESLTTGTGFTTQMKPDVKAAAMDVGLTVAPVAKKAGQAAVKAGKKVLDATKDLPVGLSIKDVGAVKLADDLTVDVAPAVRTKNFKNWFGDSKVVDDQGKPIVLYHGTKTSFDVFKPSKHGAQGPGIYFTDNPKEAGMYTRGLEDSGQNIVPVYVSMKNPLRVGPGDNVFEMIGASDDNIVDVLKSKGYDGIIWDRVEDPWSIKVMKDAGLDPTGNSRHFVVFDPTQIKSAIGNVGTFDPKNPSIIRGAAAAPAVPAAMQDEETK